MDLDMQAVCEVLMPKANVVGVGIGYKYSNGEMVRDSEGRPVQCVVVSVSKKLPSTRLTSEDIIPKEVAGEPTDVIETGPVSIISDLSTDAEATMIDPQQRIRPIFGGLSIGLNPGVTAGTLGIVVKREGDSSDYLLSNWHVIADNNVPVNERPILDITQPGNFDGGRPPTDTVAQLSHFVPINSGDTGGGGGGGGTPSPCGTAAAVAWLPNIMAAIMGSRTRLVPMIIEEDTITIAQTENLVDAALARITVPFEKTIAEIGAITGTGNPTLGMRVQKFGRTTSYTVGTVTQINATFTVQGYPGGPAIFTDQVAISADSGPFLQGGDSGSALISMDNQAVGLCFAGSDAIGIANRWENVASALNITL